jgi:Multicopper oxidase
VRALTHLHGGNVADTDDGNPHATQTEFAPGKTNTVTYPSDQEAGTVLEGRRCDRRVEHHLGYAFFWVVGSTATSSRERTACASTPRPRTRDHRPRPPAVGTLSTFSPR